jgi:predicted alpha/beta-hydrolase family hydrolase
VAYAAAVAEHLIQLAPGASGGLDGIDPYLRRLRTAGFRAEPVQLPKGTAERALPVWRAAVTDSAAVIGGQSFGGRVASLLAAEQPVAGLVLICYPLHPPGSPDRWEQRTAHWPGLDVPILLLSGDRDPFARIELLRDAVKLLPRAELVEYPGIGHGLKARADDVVDRIAAFVHDLD